MYWPSRARQGVLLLHKAQNRQQQQKVFRRAESCPADLLMNRVRSIRRRWDCIQVYKNLKVIGHAADSRINPDEKVCGMTSRCSTKKNAVEYIVVDRMYRVQYMLGSINGLMTAEGRPPRHQKHTTRQSQGGT